MVNDPIKAQKLIMSFERIFGKYCSTIDIPPERNITIRPSVCTESGSFIHDGNTYEFSNQRELCEQIKELARNEYNLVNLTIREGDTGPYISSNRQNIRFSN